MRTGSSRGRSDSRVGPWGSPANLWLIQGFQRRYELERCFGLRSTQHKHACQIGQTHKFPESGDAGVNFRWLPATDQLVVWLNAPAFHHHKKKTSMIILPTWADNLPVPRPSWQSVASLGLSFAFSLIWDALFQVPPTTVIVKHGGMQRFLLLGFSVIGAPDNLMSLVEHRTDEFAEFQLFFQIVPSTSPGCRRRSCTFRWGWTHER